MSTTKLLAPATLSDGAVVQTEYGNYAVANGTATVDSRAVGDLINAGWRVWDDDLAANKALRAGAYTTTAGDNTANTVSIPTGLTSIDAIVGLTILRAGKVLTNLAAVSVSAGNIVVADNSTDFVLGTGDVIHWGAIGVL